MEEESIKDESLAPNFRKLSGANGLLSLSLSEVV